MFIKLQTPRGTRDYLPEEAAVRRIVEDSFRRTFDLWGYQEIRTPTFEFFDVLATGTGAELEDSMFKFQDKSGRLIALRAEMTASTARVVGTQLLNSLKPIRLWYIANMFRYDEPQAGRQREFWQAGIELVGSSLPEADAEAIALMIQALKDIGLKDVRIDVGQVGIFKELIKQGGLEPETVDQIRTSIDKKDRQTLEKALEASNLNEDTKKILRLLPDLRGGTEVLNRLSELTRSPEIGQIVENLKKTLDCLKSYAVPEGAITIDLGIIRGIDYYTGVVFEAYVPALGMALGGGGRYDDLIREFSSSDVPATGFAIGVDRCMLALEKQAYPFLTVTKSTALILPVTEKMRGEANRIANLLRQSGISTETDISGWNLSRGLSYGSRANIPYVVVLGEEEYGRGTAVVRDMKAGKQTEVKIDDLPVFLRGEKT